MKENKFSFPRICQIIVGILFIFSGFVKAVDPLGSTYKFTDYFEAFHLEALSGLASPMSITLASLEFLLGLNLVSGTCVILSSIFTLGFMGFFTILTFILALFNPVSDCGCFGDALILTNWETFGKNVVLLILTIVIFVTRQSFKGYSIKRVAIATNIIGLLFISGVIFYGVKHLPILDFRPYSIGTHIPSKMVIPEGAPQDEYKITFLYEKEGQVQEFTLENYPASDTTWHFVDQKSVLLKEGYHPPIHDFSIHSDMEGDLTDMVLENQGYTFLVISTKLKEAPFTTFEKLDEAALRAQEKGHQFLMLTASTGEEVTDMKNQVNFPIYNTDEITLKTIVRANPGVLLLKEGTIYGKWNAKDFPDEEVLENPGSYVLTQNRRHQNQFIILSLGIFLATLMMLIHQWGFKTTRANSNFKR